MKTFRNIHYILLTLPLVVAGCTGADLWDSMPASIKAFIDLYYPNSEVASYVDGKDSYIVRLEDGPGFTFDSEMKWTRIDGYGMPLKEILIYDQAPEPLYNYLATINEQAGVFVLGRTAKEYQVQLLTDSLVYTIATGEVRTVM